MVLFGRSVAIWPTVHSWARGILYAFALGFCINEIFGNYVHLRWLAQFFGMTLPLELLGAWLGAPKVPAATTRPVATGQLDQENHPHLH